MIISMVMLKCGTRTWGRKRNHANIGGSGGRRKEKKMKNKNWFGGGKDEVTKGRGDERKVDVVVGRHTCAHAKDPRWSTIRTFWTGFAKVRGSQRFAKHHRGYSLD